MSAMPTTPSPNAALTRQAIDAVVRLINSTTTNWGVTLRVTVLILALCAPLSIAAFALIATLPTWIGITGAGAGAGLTSVAVMRRVAAKRIPQTVPELHEVPFGD